MIPKAYGAGTLSSALTLAAALGNQTTDWPIRVKVRHESMDKTSVHIGLKQDLKGSSQSPEIQAQADGLWILGDNDERLMAAAQSVSRPDLTAQMEEPFAEGIDTSRIPHPPSTRIGSAAFTDLGLPISNLSGLGNQTTTIQLYHPPGAQLGRGSQLRLKFRHAAILLQGKSMLTLKINDQPIGSIALTPENANNGELLCTLPIEIVDSNSWLIQITAHHEVPNPDCSKQYEAVAWTTILGSSIISLKAGSLAATPYLEGFPCLRDQNGKLPKTLTVGLGSAPGINELSLAATLVARATQTNRENAEWKASLGAVTGREDILIGTLSEEDRFRPLADALMVVPRKVGWPIIKKGIALLPSALNDAVVIQAIRNAHGGTTYIILGSSDDALDRFINFFACFNGANLLKGQLAVYEKHGKLISIEAGSRASRSAAEEEEMARYGSSMNLVAIAIGIFVLILAIFVGRKFIKRRDPRTKQA